MIIIICFWWKRDNYSINSSLLKMIGKSYFFLYIFMSKIISLIKTAQLVLVFCSVIFINRLTAKGSLAIKIIEFGRKPVSLISHHFAFPWCVQILLIGAFFLPLVYHKSNKGLITAMDFCCTYLPTDKLKIWLSFFWKKIKFKL